MSVDTYLKGKDTSAYARVQHDGIEVLVAPAMARWAQRISLAAKPGLVRRGLRVSVDHDHGPACRH